jgi:hypothetical protein
MGQSKGAIVGRVSMRGRIRQKSSNGGMTYHRHTLFAKICSEFAETCSDEVTSLASNGSGEKYPDQQHDGQCATANDSYSKPKIIAHAVKL